MANERNAGRKRALTEEAIREYLERHHAGESVTKLAKEAGVSRQTMSVRLNEASAESVLVELEDGNPTLLQCRLASYWLALNDSILKYNKCKDSAHDYPTRIEYMLGDKCMTAILVNWKEEKILIENYTNSFVLRAFGNCLCPDWEDFQDFLEYRCFSRDRYDRKEILRSLGLDSYDPIQIVEKTAGRLVDDDLWMRFYYAGY